jgi:DNA-binding HxlR family transcriptional regulator
MTTEEVAKKISYVQDTLYVIGGKWKLPIIIALYHENTRFKDLKNCIPKITSRVLSKELKDLEANQMITRTVYDTTPVSVEYKLTEYCFTAKEVVIAMELWGENHRKKISGK